MNELFSIKDQVVVITGGTGVLGRCIAKYLAKEGAKVVIMGRKAEVGNEIVADIKANGGEAMFLVTDVMNVQKVEENLQDILKAYGRVDALLNAAGGNMPGATIAPTGNFFDLDPEQFKRVLDLNLTGTVIPTQVFLKPMVEQGKGSIINFSSMAAFRPMTRVCGYAAAKAGISNFTAFMANEVATKFTEKIRVNAIAPGFFLTEQNLLLLTDGKGNLTERGQDVIRQGVVRHRAIPAQRSIEVCHRHRCRGRRRIQHVCDVQLYYKARITRITRRYKKNKSVSIRVIRA